MKQAILKPKQIKEYIENSKEAYPDNAEYAKRFYLDYVNNYLTVAGISEDYNLSIIEATNWLNIGRRLNRSNA